MAKKGRSSENAAARPAVTTGSFDSELDALFSSAAKNAAAAAVPPKSVRPATTKKRDARTIEPDEEEDEEEEENSDAEEDGDDDDDDDDNDDDDDEALIDSEVEDDEEHDSERDSSDAHSDILVHETLLKGKKEETGMQKKSARTTEPQEVRDRRSIFVGNLPISILQDRPAIKALKRHLIAQSPYPSCTGIEVLRFRSIPFAKPTDDYEARHPEEAERNVKRRNRSQAYKDALASAEDGAIGTSSTSKPKYLTGSQKRKIAFITQKVNEKADSVNAYVTLSPLSEKLTSSLREQNGAAKVDRLTANVLAALLARSAHNSIFEGRHLRVDLVTSLRPYEVVESGLDKVKTADGSILGAIAGGGGVDVEGRRKTAFVGNMDFETREEEVRTFFNQLLTQERGQAPSLQSLDFSHCTTLPEPEKRLEDDLAVGSEQSWVQDVRIIRDGATQMGKGFGYVRFLDDACVDEIIALHESEEAFLAAAKAGKGTTPSTPFRRKLKLKGRPLRVSRCKVPKGHVTSGRQRGGGKGGESSEHGGTRTPRPDGKQHAGQRSRSTGAPTPGGTSPYAKRQKLSNGRPGVDSSPTRSTQRLVPNPSPRNTDPLRAAEVARKKADPDRQARRMAKKTAKRTEQKMKAIVGDGKTSGKVSLKPKGSSQKNGAGSQRAKSTHQGRRQQQSTGNAAGFTRRAIGTLALLASFIALAAQPVQANNEIVNFGPVLCAADEVGLLQDNAARKVSQSWPVLRSLHGPKLFTLDPITAPDVWLTLLLVPDEEDEQLSSSSSNDRDTIERVQDLASKAFPLRSREEEEEEEATRSPRDRWLESVPRTIGWYAWQKRFTFRVNWAAHHPIVVRATVHDARTMLASGKARWQANEHVFEAQKRTEDEEREAPQWPCARLYVHLHVHDSTVFIPPKRRPEERRAVKTFLDRIYLLLADVAEWYIGPLTNEGPDAMEAYLQEQKTPSPFRVPVHLVLEPIYLGFVPHTSLYLLAVLVPLLLLTYIFAVPFVHRIVDEILAELEGEQARLDDDDDEQDDRNTRRQERKTQ